MFFDGKIKVVVSLCQIRPDFNNLSLASYGFIKFKFLSENVAKVAICCCKFRDVSDYLLIAFHSLNKLTQRVERIAELKEYQSNQVPWPMVAGNRQ